jgi:AraC-like DNA-binding protein/mannose-6-phosphate isomerase-like protein (cupin superfamily)
MPVPRSAGGPGSALTPSAPGGGLASATAAFLDSITLERATLQFCERFDDRSRIWNFQKHAHPYFELIFFLEGKANVDAGDDSLDISLYDVLVYPPGLVHTEHLDLDRRQEIICLWADLGACARFDHALKLPDTRGAFRQLFEAIYLEFTGNRRHAQELIACHLRTLVWLLRQHFAEPVTESHNHVERCLDFIHERYASDFPIEALAKVVFVSPSYLFRIFRKKMGVTPMHYRNLVRVDKAKLLLLDRSLKMEEIAARVGFEDAKYFARVFRKETGSSPSEFRRRNGGR